MAIKIYIDQGHNPENPNAGSEGNGIREQDITYEVGRLTADLFRQNGNFEVRLSRPTPETQLGNSLQSSLSARTREANSWGADYFLSIHTNAVDNPQANGTEAFVFSMGASTSEWAESMLEEISELTGIRERGVFARPGLYVLRKTEMPAVLLELGFITNPREAAIMRDTPELFAEGIYRGTLDFLDLSQE